MSRFAFGHNETTEAIRNYRNEVLNIPREIEEEMKGLIEMAPEEVLLAEKYFAHYKEHLRPASDKFFGYPETPYADPETKVVSGAFSQVLLNNAGDPFDHSGYWRTHTKHFECEVIHFFGKLFHFQDVWGYVTSGGTEGNLEGLYVGRNYLRTKYNKVPKAFYSTASHYSIKKNVDILGMDLVALPVNEKDEMDLAAFEKAITETPLDVPLLISVNIGTTMKGAIDDFQQIVQILKRHNREDYYIHADMALYGLIYRFYGDFDGTTFSQYISSFAISGHKFLAQSAPCGIFIGHKEKIDVGFDTQWVSYIGSRDNTISGSRNGLLALLLHAKVSKGEEYLKQQANSCIEVCNYLYQQMNEVLHYPCHRANDQYAVIVYFDKPPEEICVKYQLAVHQNNLSHVVCMPHISKEMIDGFISDLRNATQNMI